MTLFFRGEKVTTENVENIVSSLTFGDFQYVDHHIWRKLSFLLESKRNTKNIPLEDALKYIEEKDHATAE